MDELTFLAAVLGGISGSVLTVGSQWLVYWWNKPVLNLAFSEDVPGCKVDTRAIRTNGDSREVIQQLYLRLKVINDGRRFARSVSLHVAEIEHKSHGSADRIFREEVLALKLALTNQQTTFNLASGGHFFIDLVHTSQSTPPEKELCFDFASTPLRLEEQGFGSGTYKMKVFVSADNAESRTFSCKWSYQNSELKILGIE